MSQKMTNFDTERFIMEIHCRPSIWDSSSQDYSNRYFKKKCWEEVVGIFGGEAISIVEKKELELELQKRWKGIRSCFAREIKRQKNIRSGSGADNRKSEYIHYKQLQFLHKVVAVRESQDEDNLQVDEDNLQEAEDNLQTAEDNLDGHYHELGDRPKKRNRKRKTSEDDDPFVRALNNSMKQRRRRQTEEVDEDKLFLLSLVSTLKGLSTHIKLATKAKMLTLLSEASDYSNNRETTFNYVNHSFGHTYNPGGTQAKQENHRPGFSSQRREAIFTSECPVTNYKTSPKYLNQSDTADSPSDTNFSNDSEP